MTDLAKLPQQIAHAEELVRPAIRRDCEKRIDWADGPVQTDLAIVYIHGFSASPRELSPVVERVAAELSANAFFTRLTGHGQDGAAMATATLEAWQADVEEALRIGRRIGRRVVLMGCSTGCTLMTLAGPAEGVVAHVHFAPNFGVKSALTQAILDAPYAHVWGPWVAGRERSFEIVGPGHEDYWTTRYPTVAVMPMAAAVRAARKRGVADMKLPALFLFSDHDQVVNPKRTHRVMQAWPGPVTHIPLEALPEDDDSRHVMAGDVFAPHRTDAAVEACVDFLKTAL